MKQKKGYVHIYTGDGKGKTTAALGLALRAAGAGMKVFIGQFFKKKGSSEFAALARLNDAITSRHYGKNHLLSNEPSEQDRKSAREGFLDAREAIMSGLYDLVILDEIILTVYFNLLAVEDLLDLIRHKPDPIELVMTGRKADLRLIEAADLVTEMKEIKHYYQTGVLARRGIES
ncbi:MAG: cob(I)yrinic acid a,c-diamide adenosyltransferase [Deltaproteobacteria bacterium]|nr:cob(I)yrinic acid a,c-diamide adenosyltransferase [Deltaproteobacteria bacterium]